MGAASGSFLSDIFEEHLDAIGFLWGQRRVAWRSPEHTVKDVDGLDEGLGVHVDGVQAAGEASIPVLEGELPVDDPLRVFAAAYALLQFNSPSATTRVLTAFRAAAAGRLIAIEEALCYAPLAREIAALEPLCQNGNPSIAVAAA